MVNLVDNNESNSWFRMTDRLNEKKEERKHNIGNSLLKEESGNLRCHFFLIVVHFETVIYPAGICTITTKSVILGEGSVKLKYY